MENNETQAAGFLTRLSKIESILADAEGIFIPQQLRFNSHIHLPANFSAFETVQQAVDLASG
ncbi:MAG: hypothetical protein ACYTET_07420 [Planctomycetota bacterium]